MNEPMVRSGYINMLTFTIVSSDVTNFISKARSQMKGCNEVNKPTVAFGNADEESCPLIVTISSNIFTYEANTIKHVVWDPHRFASF
jgi:hypothetical protein